MFAELQAPICINCQHRKAGEWHCAAFPKRIPEKIIQSIVDHRKAIKGDNGILYDPIDPEFELPDYLGQGEIDQSVLV